MLSSFAINVKGLKTKFLFAIAGVLLFIILTILSNLWEARHENFRFYFSESLLFSTFWLLFAPILFFQIWTIQKAKLWYVKLLLSLGCMALHLYFFPAWVWMLSKLFYYHTFNYYQTLKFTITEYGITLFLIYTLPLFYPLFIKNNKTQSVETPQTETDVTTTYTSVLTVSDRNKKIAISVADVLYFSAQSPYVGLQVLGKQYLYNSSLKALMEELNPTVFVRIHKSTIVNLAHIKSYQSRQNGDYDLLLSNRQTIRLSRNYAPRFKDQLAKYHQLTTN